MALGGVRPIGMALGHVHDYADTTYLIVLLRAHRKRPYNRRSTNQRNERRSPHQSTWGKRRHPAYRLGAVLCTTAK